MKTIWKFPLTVTHRQTMQVPQGAQLLTVQIQMGGPYIWALVDPAATLEARTIVVYGTGHPMDDDVGRYVGTFQIEGGALVFHVFEEA